MASTCISQSMIELSQPRIVPLAIGGQRQDARVRVVKEVHKESDKKEQFEGLTEEEALPAASTNPQLDYAFYKVGKGVEAWMERCPNIKTWRDGIGTDVIMT